MSDIIGFFVVQITVQCDSNVIMVSENSFTQEFLIDVAT